MTILQTTNLLLSPCSTTDCADFVGLERDPEVMRYLSGGFPIDRSKFQADTFFLLPTGTEDCVWTARRSDNGAFVGWFCLCIESEGLAELGYRLRRAEWGQGFATEGATALVTWGLFGGGYERVFASTMSVNHASRRVLEKVGMKYVRTIYPDFPVAFPGTEQGEAVYEMRRDGMD